MGIFREQNYVLGVERRGRETSRSSAVSTGHLESIHQAALSESHKTNNVSEWWHNRNKYSARYWKTSPISILFFHRFIKGTSCRGNNGHKSQTRAKCQRSAKKKVVALS